MEFTEQDIAKDRADRNRLQEQTTKGQASSDEVNVQKGIHIYIVTCPPNEAEPTESLVSATGTAGSQHSVVLWDGGTCMALNRHTEVCILRKGSNTSFVLNLL